MKTLIFILGLSTLGYLFNEKIIDLAMGAGFQKYSKTAILEDQRNNQVECTKFAIGFLNKKGIDAKFHACVDKYESEGFTVTGYHST